MAQTKLVMMMAVTFLFSSAAMAAGTGICVEGDFVEVNDREVRITVQGASYSPKCVKVKPGTVVTIEASGRHPLQGIASQGGAPNPFVMPGEAESAQTRVLSQTGLFEYLCVKHFDSHGMAGAILVEE